MYVYANVNYTFSCMQVREILPFSILDYCMTVQSTSLIITVRHLGSIKWSVDIR